MCFVWTCVLLSEHYMCLCSHSIKMLNLGSVQTENTYWHKLDNTDNRVTRYLCHFQMLPVIMVTQCNLCVPQKTLSLISC